MRKVQLRGGRKEKGWVFMFLRKHKMDHEACGQGRLDWWEGEKVREQEGGGWAAVLGSGRARSLCVMDPVFSVKEEAGL